MRRYTILHTIETSGPGGAETVLLNLATHLDPQRFRSVALLPSLGWLGVKLRQNGVPTYIATSRSWWDSRLPRAIARIVREEKVDLVHSHLPDQNFYSCIARCLTGCKTVVTYHGPIELSRRRHTRDRIKLWIVRRSAAAVVVVCDFMATTLSQAGFASDRLVRIYNGVNVERFQSATGGHLRQELALSNGYKLVGTVANIRQTKGYECFIRSAKKVCDADARVRFVAVGDIDEVLAKPLRRLVEELGLSDRIHFVGFREDVPEILQDLDVFVLASTSEGFPLATLEAMSAAKPVVATRCGGPQEVVEHGSTGYLVPVGDADALAEHISSLLAAPEKAKLMGARGRNKVQRQFGVAEMVASYEGLYDRLLGGE